MNHPFTGLRWRDLGGQCRGRVRVDAEWVPGSAAFAGQEWCVGHACLRATPRQLGCYARVVRGKSKKLATPMVPRERTLEVCLLWLSLAAPPVWVTLLVQAWREDISLSSIFCLIGITSLLPALYFLRARLGYALGTKLCVLVLFATAAFVESIVGFTPPTAVMVIFALLLATLLLGDKAFSPVLLACIASLALGWLLHEKGLHPHNVERLVDPSSPLVWLRFGLALGVLGGAVRDWARSSRSLEQEELMNELGGVLASSLDAEQTLRELSRRVVRHFADFCLVFVIEDGQLKHAHTAARDPAREPLAAALGSVAPESSDGHLAGNVLRTRKTELVKLSHPYLVAHRQGAEHVALLRSMGARSLMSAPVVTSRGELRGVLSAVSSSRVYDAQDLRLLSNLAARAAMAIENASLYADLRRAHDEIRAQFQALDGAQQKIRALEGLLPVCAWCGRIRDDRQFGRWRRLGEFLTERTSALVTHSICPDCTARLEDSLLGEEPPRTG